MTPPSLARRRARRGSTVIETAMFIPVLVLFIVGMIQVGKITYLYYTLKKMMYTVGTYLATQQGVDFCADSTGQIAAATNLALTGTTDGSGTPVIDNLTSDMISVQAECYDPNALAVGPCNSNTCDPVAGGPPPNFVVVSIPDGYLVQPHIPYLTLDPIPLKPAVRVPFGGT
ncbi:MAG TPA: TadE/TadG family type IV pilus assembly protein [Bryobacteraceae bacterium]|nr:TadE/TadG family type IV pilus assembly protein [Bryobacteraceae bacterium]